MIYLLLTLVLSFAWTHVITKISYPYWVITREYTLRYFKKVLGILSVNTIA